jgi:HD-GYP domain-containing protein (c-di-GMP phosphodiesterase class II)
MSSISVLSPSISIDVNDRHNSTTEARSTVLERLLQIGTLLSAERDLERLLTLILNESRAITGSDGGSIYLVDRSTQPVTPIFKAAQNDSIPEFAIEKMVGLPLLSNSLVGYVAATGKTLNITDAAAICNDLGSLPYRVDRSFDRQFGYQTISVLVLPMQNRSGETIGVLQSINRKRDPSCILTADNARELTIPYTEWEERIVRAIASQAAVAIEREGLQQSIEHLFDGFVKASVHAIEARDPSTAGHSERVAVLSLGLCEAVDGCDRGVFRDIRFSENQLQELHYAALLHDFGKVSVPEKVLQKEKKLHPEQLALLEARFKIVKQSWQLRCAEQKIKFFTESPTHEFHDNGNSQCDHCRILLEYDRELNNKIDRLQRARQNILQLNEPSIFPSKEFGELLETVIANLYDLTDEVYTDLDGKIVPLITTTEIQQLLIARGTLTSGERDIIEAHVRHTYEFLRRIPWTSHLSEIPKIASAHHEKLDGSGYPWGLTAEAIPLQSQIMAIADIYDALTASDRPYKPRLSIAKSLDILHQEAANNKLNSDLLNLFIEEKIYRQLGHD